MQLMAHSHLGLRSASEFVPSHSDSIVVFTAYTIMCPDSWVPPHLRQAGPPRLSCIPTTKSWEVHLLFQTAHS